LLKLFLRSNSALIHDLLNTNDSCRKGSKKRNLQSVKIKKLPNRHDRGLEALFLIKIDKLGVKDKNITYFFSITAFILCESTIVYIKMS